MYFIYVDESGDTGRKLGSSPLFILSGMVVHELVWHDTLERAIAFRQDLRVRFGLKLREEIHCIDFLHRPRQLARIAKHQRLMILRECLDFLEQLPEVSVINVIVKKAGKPASYDVFDNAWRALLQRFHNTMSYRNFPGPRNTQDFGLVVADRTDEPKLRSLARKLRRYNPVPGSGGMPHRMIPLTTLVEDAVHRDSTHSYFLQTVDVCAYFLKQLEGGACNYVRRKGGANYFKRLNNVLCKVAATNDPQGIVRL